MKKVNNKKPYLSWLEMSERLFWQQYNKDIIKAWEEARPMKLRKFRSGTVIVTGTK